MAAKQKIMNERIARVDKEQDVLLVLTGTSKGKSNSGFGMLARALGHEYLDLDQVLDDLQARPKMQHAIVTGRYAPQQLIDLADTVTEMKVVKHAFKDQGIKAQKGIEL